MPQWVFENCECRGLHLAQRGVQWRAFVKFEYRDFIWLNIEFSGEFL
jgi:hypothetical protein